MGFLPASFEQGGGRSWEGEDENQSSLAYKSTICGNETKLIDT